MENQYQCSLCGITGDMDYIQNHLISHQKESTSVKNLENCGNAEKENDGFWTENECLALISTYENHVDDFKNAKKRKLVWEQISEELMSLGVKRTATKCERKWLNMVRVYRNKKDCPTKTGRGALSTFKYFDKLDEILSDRPSNSSNVTIDVGLNIEKTNNEVEENDAYNIKRTLSESEDDLPIKTFKTNTSKKIEYFELKLQTKKEERQKKEEWHKELVNLKKERLVLERKKIEYCEVELQAKKEERKRKEERHKELVYLEKEKLFLETRKLEYLELKLQAKKEEKQEKEERHKELICLEKERLVLQKRKMETLEKYIGHKTDL